MKTDFETLAADLARTVFYAEYPVDPRIQDFALDQLVVINTSESPQAILAAHLELKQSHELLSVFEELALKRAKALLDAKES
jgi:hypothetical protein